MKRSRHFAVTVTLAILMLVMPAFAFAETYDGLVQVRTILVTSVTGNGAPIGYPAASAGRGEVTAAEVMLGSGAETGWHIHAIPVYAYVLSGTLAVYYADGTSRIFRTGEAIVEVVDTAHNGRTVGADPVRLIVFYTGIQGMPNVVKVAAPQN